MADTNIVIHVTDPDVGAPRVTDVEFVTTKGTTKGNKTAPHAGKQALQIDIVTPPGVGGGDCVMSGGFMWCPP